MKNEYIRANIVSFLLLLGWGLTTSLLSVYLSERGIGLANIGLIFGIGAILAGFFRVPLGAIVDCFGRKRFMLLGAIGYPIFSVGLIYADTVAHFILLRLFIEFFAAVFWTAHSAYLFDSISNKKEGAELGIRNAVWFTTTAFAPVLAGILATNLGYTYLFFIGAAISTSAIFVVLTIKEHNGKQDACRIALEQEYKNILKIRGLGTIAAIIFLVDFVFVFWGIFAPIWLEQQGLSLGAIGAILSTTLLLSAILQIPLGKAIDKWPLRMIILPGFLLFWLGGILFFAFRNYFSYMINRMALGLGSDAAYWPAVGMLAKLTPKAEHGGAVAFIFGLAAAISGFGALLGGWLTSKFGIEPVLTSVSFLALLAAVFLMRSRLLWKKGTQLHKAHHARVIHKHCR